MTTVEFVMNLRSEMTRQGLDLQDLLRRLDPDDDERVPVIGFDRAYWLCNGMPKLVADPTPEEITAIATALGCPEERLTVSREELERRVTMLEAQVRSFKQKTYSSKPEERPDDSRFNEAIAKAESLDEALWEITEKYGLAYGFFPTTNNMARWDRGVYLRSIGALQGEITDACAKFLQPELAQELEEVYADNGRLRTRVAELEAQLADADQALEEEALRGDMLRGPIR